MFAVGYKDQIKKMTLRLCTARSAVWTPAVDGLRRQAKLPSQTCSALIQNQKLTSQGNEQKMNKKVEQKIPKKCLKRQKRTTHGGRRGGLQNAAARHWSWWRLAPGGGGALRCKRSAKNDEKPYLYNYIYIIYILATQL